MAFGLTRSTDQINWLCPVNWMHPLNDGLVGWWMAIQNQGGWKSDTWLDLTDPVYGNHGTLTNMDPATDWVSVDGAFGGLSFSQVGADDVVVAPHRSEFNLSETAGCVIWTMKAPHAQGQNNPAIFDKGDGDDVSDHTWFIRFPGNLDDGTIRFFIEDGTVDFASASYPDNEWVRMGLQWDGTNVDLYREGDLIESVAQPTGTFRSGNTASFHIGALMSTAGALATDCTISSVRLHSSLLTDTQIAEIHREDKQVYPNLLNRVPQRYYNVQAVAGGSRWNLAPSNSSPTAGDSVKWKVYPI